MTVGPTFEPTLFASTCSLALTNRRRVVFAVLAACIAELVRGSHRGPRADVAWLQIATQKPVPFIYKRGDRGPKQADERLADLGFMRTHNYVGPGEWGK